MFFNYDAEKLNAVIEAVRSGQMSQQTAARHCDIPQSTIADRRSGRILPGAQLGRPPLIGRIQLSADNGFGVSPLGVMSNAYRLAEALKLKHPFTKNRAGKILVHSIVAPTIQTTLYVVDLKKTNL